MVLSQHKMAFRGIKPVTACHTTFYSLCICRHWTGWAYSLLHLTCKTKDCRRGCLELPGAGNAPPSFHCTKGIILKVFFCISSFLLPKVTSLAFLHLWWISDRLSQAMQPIAMQGELLDSLIPPVASLLEIFSWPFTSLSNWLCIWHRFLPNCPSQHELTVLLCLSLQPISSHY